MNIFDLVKLIILCFSVVVLNAQSSEYTCTRDVIISSVALQQSALIASFSSQNNRFACIRECNKNMNCVSCSFDKATHQCFLYNRAFASADFAFANNLNFYTKKAAAVTTTTTSQGGCNCSLLHYFQKISLNSSISTANSISFNSIMSTEMVIVNNTVFYLIADNGNGELIKISDSWGYITKISFPQPRVIKWANGHLYITSNHGFYKMDYNFNIFNSILESSAFYAGIHQNASDNTLAVAIMYRNRLDFFDDNLNVLANMTLNYQPSGVSGYGDSLYVSAVNPGTFIYVIRNRQVINTIYIDNLASSYVHAILFDDYGYMALCFQNEKKVKLYAVNGTSTGLQLTITNLVYYANFDFNGRLMISATSSIDFYS